MRKRQGLRKRPKNIRKAEWDSLPDYVKEKLLLRRRETEEKANLLNLPDFAKGIVAAEAGLPMDLVELTAGGAGTSHAQRLTQMRPGGHPGYEEKNFVPEFKGTSRDIYSKLGGTPESGSGLAGELLAPGAAVTLPFMAAGAVKQLISKVPKMLDSTEVLSKVFRYPKNNRIIGRGDPIFGNLGMDETASLFEKLKAEAKDGDIIIAKDRLKGMVNETDPSKRLYNKQIREYTDFDNWLDKYENTKAEGKKKFTTVSLNDLEDFWAQNNLDLRESTLSGGRAYSDSYAPKGGHNQQTYVMTYHGKKPAMTLRTSNNLNELSERLHKKPFEELTSKEQSAIEEMYPVEYPEDIDAKLATSHGRPKYLSSATGQHFENNAVFHLRMDDRVGVGAQKGEKQLNVFELQSDWYKQAHKSGAWDFEIIDDNIYELNRQNLYLSRKLEKLETPEGRTKAGQKIMDEMVDNELELTQLRKMKDELEKSKEGIDNILTSDRLPQSVRKMPFISPGDNVKWMELALKKILKKAIDDGYDRISFGSYEVHKKLYPSYVKKAHKIKIKRNPANTKFQINKVKTGRPSGLSDETFELIGDVPISGKTEVTGREYPYHIELYDKNDNIIRVNNEGNNDHQDTNLNRVFGELLANRIREKAQTRGKTILQGEDLEPFDIGLEHIKVLYENVLPNIMKGNKGSKIFKKLGLKPEKIKMGSSPTKINPLDEGNTAQQPIPTGAHNALHPTPDPGPDLESLDMHLGELGFSSSEMPDGGRPFATNENFEALYPGAEDLQDFYNSSQDFAIAVEDTRLPDHVTEGLINALETMRKMEIKSQLQRFRANFATGDALQFDSQYKLLMHPETRPTELSHIAGELEENGVKIVRDPNEIYPPRFQYNGAMDDELTSSAQYDNAFKGDAINDDFVRAWTTNGEMVDTRPNLDRIMGLIKRYELAGHPEFISMDPNRNGNAVLDISGSSWGTDYELDQMPTTISDGIYHEGLDMHDLVSGIANNNPFFNQAREALSEMGVQVAWHSEPPYLSYTTDDLRLIADEDPADVVDLLGPEGLTEYRGEMDFMEAIRNENVGPNLQGAGDDGRYDEIIAHMDTMNRELLQNGVPNQAQPLANIAPPVDFLPNPGTDYRDVANLQNETYDLLPENIRTNLQDLKQSEAALLDNFNIKMEWGELGEPLGFRKAELLGEGGEIIYDYDTFFEQNAQDLYDMGEELFSAFDNEMSHFINTHEAWELNMSQWDFDFDAVNVNETPRSIDLKEIDGMDVISWKLTDDNGNLLEKLKPLKDGGKLYYGALPPGMLAAGAASQGQQQSLLE